MAGQKWIELSNEDFNTYEKDNTLVILPIGSTEQHGPHLPVGTDSLLVESFINGIQQKLNEVDFLVLPTLWCSKSTEHKEFSGTVYLSRRTLEYVLEDIAECVSAAGFRKLVLINGHGGNTDLLNCMARDIRQITGLLTFMFFLGPLYYRAAIEVYKKPDFDVHAGHIETSMILSSYPELVKDQDFSGIGSDLKRGKVAATFTGFEYLHPASGGMPAAWITKDYSEDGVVGNPSDANIHDGRSATEFVIDELCKMLKEAARFEYQD